MMRFPSIRSIIIRYALLFIIGLIFLFNYSLLYKILSLLTSYPSYFILNLFYNASLAGNEIIINDISIILIPACLGLSAYLLFLILNLTTPTSLENHLKVLLFAFISFFILNIIRIIIFSIFFIEGFAFFNFTHLLFWYLGSTLLVVIIWFASIRIFKIKSVPVYTDIKFIISKISLGE